VLASITAWDTKNCENAIQAQLDKVMRQATRKMLTKEWWRLFKTPPLENFHKANPKSLT